MANIIRLQAFSADAYTIKILIGTIGGFRLHASERDHVEAFQISYRLCSRRWRLNSHDWVHASPGSDSCAFLYPVLPSRQYQVSVVYRTRSKLHSKQLFHFSSPELFIPENKVKIFNTTPNNPMQVMTMSIQDSLLVKCLVAVLLKKASSIMNQVRYEEDCANIEQVVAEWGTSLLEKVVQNQDLAEKKSLVVQAIIQSMLNAIEQHYQELVLAGSAKSSKSYFKKRLEEITEKCFKAEHKRSGKASHVLRMMKHIIRELFQTHGDRDETRPISFKYEFREAVDPSEAVLVQDQ